MSHRRIAIIGCGAAVDRYYIPAFRRFRWKDDQLYLVDANLERAREVAAKIGYGTARESYDDLPGIEGVINVLPNNLHYPVTMEFLSAGTHVLCEKPLAQTAEEVANLNRMAREKKVSLCVNHTRRLFPSFANAKAMISDGVLGQLKSIEYYEGSVFGWPSLTGFYVDPRVSSRGILSDLGPHVLDTVSWLVGGKPNVLFYKDDSMGGPESLVQIVAEFNGCRIDIVLNRLFELENRFRIEGERGTLTGTVNGWDTLLFTRQNGKEKPLRFKSRWKNYPEFVLPIVNNFLEVLQGRAQPLISGEDAETSICWIADCYSRRKSPSDPAKSRGGQKKGKVLVTGATGFVGGRLMEVLHSEEDFTPRAAIRNWATASRLGRLPVEIMRMDILNPKEIDAALDGVSYVIHCAKGGGGAIDEGTRNLLEAAHQKGVKKLIHLSTADVYGDVAGEMREEIPWRYNGSEYNRAKIEAEKVCGEYSAKGLPVVILRPSIIYGPFSTYWSLRFAHFFRKREWLLYESHGEGNCNLVYVDDLIKAILLCLENSQADGQVFNISGPQVITWNEYLVRFNQAMGLPPLRILRQTQATARTKALEPVRILGRFVQNNFLGPAKKVAETFEFADRIIRRTESLLKSSPSPEDLKLYDRKALFPGDKAREVLRFEPVVSVDEGLQRTVDWLREQGFFKRVGED